MTAEPGDVGRARAFARAALDLAGTPAEADAVVNELDAVATLVKENRELADLLESPLLNGSAKAEVAVRLFAGRAGELTVQLLQVMAEHDALGLAGLVVEQLRAERDERQGVLRVEAVTAVALGEEAKRALAGRLGELLGRTVILVERVEPAVIGGLVLRIGDTVIDGSVRQQLEQVRQEIISRGEHEIQVGRNLVAD